MPLPEIFTNVDPSEEKLAGYFEEMYEYLIEEGVPEDRLPGPWHMLSRMVKCLDPELFREWLDAYAAVESEEQDLDDDEDDDVLAPYCPRPRPQRRRPEYLKALTLEPEELDVEETDEISENDGG